VPESDESAGARQLPRSAQLRLLRSAQNRLLERTRVYETRFSGQTPSDASRQQLQSLVRQQAELDQELRKILEGQ
jgi:U3 small nucleolar ribonucleoprotein component